MPKQILKIERFDGGINNHDDPRDIGNNQLAEADGIMVNKRGRITMQPDMAAHGADGGGGRTTKGFGLFAFSHDYPDAQDGPDNAETPALTHYLAHADGTNTASSPDIEIYNFADDAWGTIETDFGAASATTNFPVTFFAVDGVLRAYNTDLSQDDPSKGMWYGYIKRERYDGTAGEDDNGAINAWIKESTATPPPTAVSTSDSDTTDPSNQHDLHVFWARASGTSDNAYGWAKTFSVGCTFVYDYHQESLMTIAGSPFVVPDLTSHAADDKINLGVYIKRASNAYLTFNKRITGINIYLKEDGQDTWYLNGHVDIDKGFLNEVYMSDYPSGGWTDNSGGSTYLGAKSGAVLLSPTEMVSYEMATGYPIGQAATHARFKSVVVVNRRAYIGHVAIKNQSGHEEIHGDLMIKSPVNGFDTFIMDNEITASINDGDEIVKLEEYADRILQFKRRKMHLINISQEIEFIEDTFVHKGIQQQCNVCKTDYGIAWVNEHGCYLYDGKNVSNLLEREGTRLIAQDTWASFYEEYSSIGYIPGERQLIIMKSCDASVSDNEFFYLFDLTTRSWVKGKLATTGAIDLNKSNWVNDYTGKLLFASDNGSGGTEYVLYWNEGTPTTSTSVNIITKDFDFGNPAVRKKIYKIYITHKGSASNIQCAYAINGINDSFTEFGSELPASSPVTDWVTTELSLSIANCYSLQLKLFSDGTTPANFEINDISIVYRIKNVK